MFSARMETTGNLVFLHETMYLQIFIHSRHQSSNINISAIHNVSPHTLFDNTSMKLGSFQDLFQSILTSSFMSQPYLGSSLIQYAQQMWPTGLIVCSICHFIKLAMSPFSTSVHHQRASSLGLSNEIHFSLIKFCKRKTNKLHRLIILRYPMAYKIGNLGKI